MKQMFKYMSSNHSTENLKPKFFVNGTRTRVFKLIIGNKRLNTRSSNYLTKI